MIYRLINSADSPLGRKALAALCITLFPLLIAFAFLTGFLWSVGDATIKFAKDIYVMIRHDIPNSFRDFASVVRTGDYI